MSKYILYLLVFILFSCQKKEVSFNLHLTDVNEIEEIDVSLMDNPSKAILSWYLLAYGNECKGEDENLKCSLLKKMGITEECTESHIDFVRGWIDENPLMKFKLVKCPNLPYNSAIQNEIKMIDLKRLNDTIYFSFSVKGFNSSEEKIWNINQKDKYVIEGNKLILQTKRR